MPTIKFNAVFGDEIKKVKLYKEPLSGSVWDIVVDGVKYHGIYEGMDKYYCHEDLFEVDDIQAIVDRICEYGGREYSQVCFFKWSTHEEYWRRFKIKPKYI